MSGVVFFSDKPKLRGVRLRRAVLHGAWGFSPTLLIRRVPALAGKKRKALEGKIVLQLDTLIGKSTLEHKLTTFGDIIYQTCLNTFGAKQQGARGDPKKSRRQCEMETLRTQKKNLRKQMKVASAEEKHGLQELWRGLKTRHSALSRAESARKKQSQMKKNQKRFFKDPFQFARQLFQQTRSGSISEQKEQLLETHIRKTYSDPDREIPLSENAGPSKRIWISATPNDSALRMYHVPQEIQVMLDDYFSGFQMRFSVSDLTTDWISLEIGIGIQHPPTSPILFVMAIEVTLKAAERSPGLADLGGGCYMPPLKAFMDDTTINLLK
ncbi:hypothetical protein EGW08_022421 [Elysia chlorotica]|uniref:Reverse transcriptase domain-containing protein n=1 Tax=Elysia chlorotica TaxID=188477 RepID=A0A3S1H0K2_ELYCH|nr:hypothetical protein EGW08_022421 [Elysia chlorotica]